MSADLEFLLDLLDQADTAYVSAEDLDGPHSRALRLCQQMGFLSEKPGVNPVPSCPHCGEGVPYWLGEKYLCDRCHSTVDGRYLLLWRLDHSAFLGWLKGSVGIHGELRQVDGPLWQLGSITARGAVHECFYRRPGDLSPVGKTRLAAYRQALVFHGTAVPASDGFRGPRLCLLEVLRLDEALSVADVAALLRPGGDVRFEAERGVVWAGDTWLGEVPVGSREHAFLACLAGVNLDAFVPYADIKREVLRRTGGADSTDEATFCQKLKSRIKKKWVAGIDRLVVTSNKGHGYRLRGAVAPR